VPTLLLLDRLFALLASKPTCEPATGLPSDVPPRLAPETQIHLQDYNRSVLELVTLPNVLIAWCSFDPLPFMCLLNQQIYFI
jgi:protein-histidine N-methyltransferase